MTRRFRVHLLLVLLPATLLAVALPPTVLAAGSNPISPPPPSQAESTPRTLEQQAVEFYNAGIGHRDRAWKLEAKRAAAPEAKKARIEEKIRKQYLGAIENYRSAIVKSPRMHQAYSGLGYALRKTGQFEGSLEAYDRALHLEPTYAEAIEYRAEAYLGLDRLEDAKSAYMELFRIDREHADTLLMAMQDWIDERAENPGDLSPGMLTRFADWVAERDELARQTASLSIQQARRW